MSAKEEAAARFALAMQRHADRIKEAARIRGSVPKLQLEVIKMHLSKSKVGDIADHIGIAPEKATAIIKAFKAFLSKKAF